MSQFKVRLLFLIAALFVVVGMSGEAFAQNNYWVYNSNSNDIEDITIYHGTYGSWTATYLGDAPANKNTLFTYSNPFGVFAIEFTICGVTHALDNSAWGGGGTIGCITLLTGFATSLHAQ